MTQTHRKWIANAMMVTAMIAMLSPTAASTAVSPWVLFVWVNIIYGYEAVVSRDWPWFWLCLFCGSWDALILFARITESSVFGFLDPLVALLSQLP